jgi:hypothetical protein
LGLQKYFQLGRVNYLLTLYHVLTELMVNGVLAHPPMLGRIDAPIASQTIGIAIKANKFNQNKL